VAKYIRVVCARYMMPASSVVMVDKLRSRPGRERFGGEHDLTRYNLENRVTAAGYTRK
jgi:hypothetical protein